jgi:hypothetical protein
MTYSIRNELDTRPYPSFYLCMYTCKNTQATGFRHAIAACPLTLHQATVMPNMNLYCHSPSTIDAMASAGNRRMHRCGFFPLLALLLGFVVLTTQTARAEDVLQNAQDLIDEAEYDQAAKMLRTALSRGGLSRSELVQLYRMQGTVAVALGKERLAQAAFRNLIVADPGFSLSAGTSPKVRAIFDEVRRELLESGGLDEIFKPEHTPPGTVNPGADVALSFRVVDNSRSAKIQKVFAFYRRVGTPHYASVNASRSDGGEYVATVPGFILDAEDEDYAFDYYIEANDADDNRLTGVGTAALPLRFEVLGKSAGADGNDGNDGTKPDIEGEDNSLLMTIGIVAGGVVVVGALIGVGVYLLMQQQGEGSATVTVSKTP